MSPVKRVVFEYKDFLRCHRYHRDKKKHAYPPAARGGALALERTALPRKATWILAAVSACLLYILIFGGIL